MASITKKRGRISREVTRERERKAWEFRTQGWTQERIAEELGVDRSAVAKMLFRYRQRLDDDNKEQMAQERTEQIERLQTVYNQAMDAWIASKSQDRTVQNRKKIGTFAGRDANDDETTVTVKDAHGDPRYLNIALQALEDLRKIMGINAPTKSVQTVENKVIGDMSEEDRARRLNDLLEGARARQSKKKPGQARLPEPSKLENQMAKIGSEKEEIVH